MPLINSLEVSRIARETGNETPLSLVTSANPKTAKGEGYGYLTGICHLAPANLAGFEVCAKRTAGCTAACLNTAGRSAFDRKIHAARIRRTRYFRSNRKGFGLMLERDIAAIVRSANRHGLKPAIRLNGTSDLPWENVRFEWADGTVSTVFERFPDVQFYDYTKIAKRFAKPLPVNYDLTFSAADGNEADEAFAIAHGARVAIVFGNASKPSARKWSLPATHNGRPVIDADTTDLRFLEPSGVYCGLRAKGLAKSDTSGFVRFVTPGN